MKLNGVISFIKYSVFGQFPHCGIIKTNSILLFLTGCSHRKMLLKGTLFHTNTLRSAMCEHISRVSRNHATTSFFSYVLSFFLLFAKYCGNAGLLSVYLTGMGVRVELPHLWELYWGCFHPSQLSYRIKKKKSRFQWPAVVGFLRTIGFFFSHTESSRWFISQSGGLFLNVACYRTFHQTGR